jgi:sulfate transport system permease protein
VIAEARSPAASKPGASGETSEARAAGAASNTGRISATGASARGWHAVAIAFGAAFTFSLIVVPLLLVFYEAFAGGGSAIAKAFSDTYAQSAIVLSLEMAAVTVVFTTLFGLLSGWTLAMYRFPGKAILQSLIDVPLSVSPVVAGLAILLCVSERSPFGAWLLTHGIRVAFAPPGIALATIFVTFPYVSRAFSAYLRERGRELEEAAFVLGASLWQTLWRVTLPDARRALAGGILLTNARALGEFGAVSVISGHIRGLTNTVPLHIENLYNEDAFPQAFALAAGLATLTIALTALRSLIDARVAAKRRE